MAGNLPYHPAPGLGDLLPGYFSVPQNPITDRLPVTMTPGIGDILPGSFPVPQNPIKDFTRGQVKMIGQQTGTGYPGLSGCGCGCNGGGGCSGSLNGHPVGMGGLSEDWSAIQTNITDGNYMGALQNTVFGIPVWAIGAFAVLILFSGGEKHSYYSRGRKAAAAF